MSKELIKGISSLRNSLNTGMVYLGGMYTLQMINGFVSVSPLTFMTSPSHCLYIFRFMIILALRLELVIA